MGGAGGGIEKEEEEEKKRAVVIMRNSKKYSFGNCDGVTRFGVGDTIRHNHKRPDRTEPSDVNVWYPVPIWRH